MRWHYNKHKTYMLAFLTRLCHKGVFTLPLPTLDRHLLAFHPLALACLLCISFSILRALLILTSLSISTLVLVIQAVIFTALSVIIVIVILNRTFLLSCVFILIISALLDHRRPTSSCAYNSILTRVLTNGRAMTLQSKHDEQNTTKIAVKNMTASML